ncbi:VanZ family protein [Leifsonia shinshuensis]|uniref:Glycopeptide antibiotics resistance protein n=1 Tax=Leifsonia shinshuensis TaxID=150026 RepID=A0A853CRS8_9MICO|nr:VanZ family protein [Leifsonia shinshuensis]NYJ22181.1 glycopeptide antibiotics resistance protein [Leifsonia shinshuensis]
MPADRRIRTRATIGLLAYTVFVAAVGLWPTPVDRPFHPLLFRLLGTLAVVGIRPLDAYDVIEFTANIAFFVPPALLLVLIAGRRRWWIAPLAGLLASVAIELTQHFFLPARFGTVQDVIANTLGAVIGTGIGVLVAGRLHANARDPLTS